MSEISEEDYLKLKEILEKAYKQQFTLEEAKVIGDGYVELFELLMDDEHSDDH